MSNGWQGANPIGLLNELQQDWDLPGNPRLVRQTANLIKVAGRVGSIRSYC